MLESNLSGWRDFAKLMGGWQCSAAHPQRHQLWKTKAINSGVWGSAPVGEALTAQPSLYAASLKQNPRD